MLLILVSNSLYNNSIWTYVYGHFNAFSLCNMAEPWSFCTCPTHFLKLLLQWRDTFLLLISVGVVLTLSELIGGISRAVAFCLLLVQCWWNSTKTANLTPIWFLFQVFGFSFSGPENVFFIWEQWNNFNLIVEFFHFISFFPVMPGGLTWKKTNINGILLMNGGDNMKMLNWILLLRNSDVASLLEA